MLLDDVIKKQSFFNIHEFDNKLKLVYSLKKHSNNNHNLLLDDAIYRNYINNRIETEICYDTINKLKDEYLIEEYIR